ncbi:MAG: sugar nucleotide-binding protein [Planctomycetota bacterium]
MVDLLSEKVTGRAFKKAGLGAGDAVINAAAMSRVGDAYDDPETARALNVDAVERLSGLCKEAGAWLVHCSTDMVFDGEHGGYTEDRTGDGVSVEPAVRGGAAR